MSVSLDESLEVYAIKIDRRLAIGSCFRSREAFLLGKLIYKANRLLARNGCKSNFSPWLKDRFGSRLSYKKANRCMNVYRALKDYVDGESGDSVFGLLDRFSPTALYHISIQRKCQGNLIEQALLLIETSDLISPKMIRCLIEELQPKAMPCVSDVPPSEKFDRPTKDLHKIKELMKWHKRDLEDLEPELLYVAYYMNPEVTTEWLEVLKKLLPAWKARQYQEAG